MDNARLKTMSMLELLDLEAKAKDDIDKLEKLRNGEVEEIEVMEIDESEPPNLEDSDEEDEKPIPVWCRYGPKCKNGNCRFRHPESRCVPSSRVMDEPHSPQSGVNKMGLGGSSGETLQNKIVGCIYPGQANPTAVIAAISNEVKAGWRRVKLTVDSGAAESVMSPEEVPDYPRKQHPHDIYYQTASGEPLKNEGEQQLLFVTPGRRLRGMKFQTCDVTKPLAAVCNMLDNDQAVVFAPEKYGGSFVVDLETGDEEPLEREDGNFVMHVWVPPPEVAESFGGPP